MLRMPMRLSSNLPVESSVREMAGVLESNATMDTAADVPSSSVGYHSVQYYLRLRVYALA